jgi:hypothetical protein
MLNLETSFMVQSCCGSDCDSAGGKKIRGVGPVGSVRSVSIDGRGGLVLKNANGTRIEPAEIGPPPELANVKMTKRQDCAKDSWKGGDVLTKPADNVQIVKDSVTGPASIQVTTERSQSTTNSMSLGFSDIVSLGVSAEITETVSSSVAVTVDIAEGQSGKLGFTATMSCSTGKGQCNGGDVEGEVCCKCTLCVLDLELWTNPMTGPTKGSDGDVVGTYRVIVET